MTAAFTKGGQGWILKLVKRPESLAHNDIGVNETQLPNRKEDLRRLGSFACLNQPLLACRLEGLTK